MRCWVLILLLCVAVASYKHVKSNGGKSEPQNDEYDDRDEEPVVEKKYVKKYKLKDSLIEDEDNEEPSRKAKQQHGKRLPTTVEKRPQTTPEEPWEICDGSDEEACTCEQHEINCDLMKFDDNTELESTFLMAKAQDNFLAYFVYARENSIKRLSKGKVFPGQESHIAELDLSHNIITTIEPGTFASFKNMSKLKLSHNHLKTIKPSFFNGAIAKGLHQLHIDNNLIKSLDDGVFENLENLRKLVLDGNPIADLNRETFRGLSNLEVLSLDNCEISKLDINVFEYLPNLKELSLRRNPLNEVPRAVNALDVLEDLDLSLTHIAEFHEQSLKKDHSLKRLYMEQMPYFYSIQVCAFCGLNSIEEIHLNNNSHLYHINPDAFGWVSDDVGKVTTLKEFWIEYCNVTEVSDELYDFAMDENLKLGLGGNPINCTCTTSFLMEGEIFNFEYSNVIPKCRYPKELAGRPLATLKQSEACSEVKASNRGNRFMQWLFIFLLLTFICFFTYHLITSGRLAAMFRAKPLAQMSYANLNTKEDEQNLEGDFQPRPAEV